MISPDIDEKIRKVILKLPSPHCDDIMALWEKWILTNPQPPYHISWADFADAQDDPSVLYSDRRVYLRRVTNELRDIEIPKTLWQKAAKALAAVASIFFVIFLALSRIARGAE